MLEKWFESSLWSSRLIVILAIHSLDQLKDKISKVIIMVLVVGFFQKVAYTEYKSALDMLYLALSITALSVGLFFLGKVGKH